MVLRYLWLPWYVSAGGPDIRTASKRHSTPVQRSITMRSPESKRKPTLTANKRSESHAVRYVAYSICTQWGRVDAAGLFIYVLTYSCLWLVYYCGGKLLVNVGVVGSCCYIALHGVLVCKLGWKAISSIHESIWCWLKLTMRVGAWSVDIDNLMLQEQNVVYCIG